MENQITLRENSQETDVQVWEKIIDVQKHFNEIKSKNQTLFISILTASLAAAGYLLLNKDLSHKYFEIFGVYRLFIFSIPVLGAMIFTGCFYILDHSIYHTLLKGSVECGKEFELSCLNMKLTSNIIENVSENNSLINIKIPFIKTKIGFIKGAGAKHKWFYGIIFVCLAALFWILNHCPLRSI